MVSSFRRFSLCFFVFVAGPSGVCRTLVLVIEAGMHGALVVPGGYHRGRAGGARVVVVSGRRGWGG